MKKILAFLLVALCLISCGKKEDIDEIEFLTPAELLDALEVKTDNIRDMSRQNLDRYNYPTESKCHGLMMCSLYAIGGGDCDPLKCRNPETGQFFRNPRMDCYQNGESGSTISRDMFLPLYHWIWQHEDLQTVGWIVDYGRSHHWRMGDGDKSRTGFRPNFQATTYELRYKLGGLDHWARGLGQLWDSSLTGYRRHLQVLHIYLRIKLTSEATKKELKILRHAAQENPRNALYGAIWAKYGGGEDYHLEAIRSLLAPDLFPNDRLPESSDRCQDYLWMRDEFTGDGEINDDWLPCDDGLVFSGVDFLFASAVIQGMD